MIMPTVNLLRPFNKSGGLKCNLPRKPAYCAGGVLHNRRIFGLLDPVQDAVSARRGRVRGAKLAACGIPLFLTHLSVPSRTDSPVQVGSDLRRRQMAKQIFHGAANGQKLGVTSCGAVEFEADREAFFIQLCWDDQAWQATSASG
jgi:hypothetical protein